MANQLRRIAILILALLVIVALLQFVMSPAHSKSSMTVTSKGIRGQGIVAGKDYREKNDQAAATYLNMLEQTLPKDSRYERRGYVSQLERENGGSRILPLREREIERELYDSKRQIPGGPDPHHHHSKRQIPGGPDPHHHRSKREIPGGPDPHHHHCKRKVKKKCRY